MSSDSRIANDVAGIIDRSQFTYKRGFLIRAISVLPFLCDLIVRDLMF